MVEIDYKVLERNPEARLQQNKKKCSFFYKLVIISFIFLFNSLFIRAADDASEDADKQDADTKKKEEAVTVDIDKAWQNYPSAKFNSKKDIDFNLNKLSKVKSLHQRVLEFIKNDKLEYVKSLIAEKTEGIKDSVSKHISAGTLYAQNSFYEQALEEFMSAKELNPSNNNIYNNIANVYYITAKYDQAIENYMLSLKYKPNDTLTLLNLSFILYETGHFSKARVSYYKAMLLSPDLYQSTYKEIGDKRE